MVKPPTLTFQTTDGITYSADPPIDPEVPYAPGQTVLVTATLTEGAWPAEMPEGWTEATDTTATYAVTFADEPCLPVVTDRTGGIAGSVCRW